MPHTALVYHQQDGIHVRAKDGGAIFGQSSAGGSTAQASAIADAVALTENSGAIGGTNNGDHPNYGSNPAALTENAGAIGGTNDGDLPDYGTAPVALTENSGAIGGTNDGDLPALVDPAGDAGASVIAGIRENATKCNELAVDITNLIAGDREMATKANELAADVTNLIAGVRENATAINTLTTKLNSVITALENAGLLAS